MMMNCDIHLYTISTVSAQQFKLRMTSKKMYILFRNPLQWYCHSQCIAEVFASVEQKSTLWHWQHAALPSTNASLWPLDQFSRVNPFEVITLSATSWCQRRSFITQLFYNFCTYNFCTYTCVHGIMNRCILLFSVKLFLIRRKYNCTHCIPRNDISVVKKCDYNWLRVSRSGFSLKYNTSSLDEGTRALPLQL